MTQKNQLGLTPFALYLTLFASLLYSINVWGQGSQQASQNTTTEEKPRTVVDVMPVFTGGEVAMLGFISQNIRYPLSAIVLGKEGRVTARFVVDKDGSIKDDVEIVQSSNPDCEQEVIRVIRAMPKWKPVVSKWCCSGYVLHRPHHVKNR